jgi:hypothetical protein
MLRGLTLKGHRDEIESLSFSSGGWRLASASRDSTSLIWDLTIALGGPPARSPAACWDDLAGADAGRAYRAIAHLAATPAVAVPFLAKQLNPVARDEVQEIRRSIAELGNGDFAVRDAAFRRLTRFGPSAAPLLRQALAENTPLENRRRIEQLLDSPGSRPWAGEALRTLRALTALERAGTPEARRFLETLAGGGAGAWLTLEAQAACARRQ